MTLAEVKERLSYLGYTATIQDDDFITYLISKVEQDIKNTLNNTIIPDELHYIGIDMTCGEFLQNKQLTGQLGDFNADNAIKRLTEGDITIEYDSKSIEINKTTMLIAHLMNHTADIIKFRSLKW